MIDRSKLSFLMQKKREKILELKRNKDNLIRKLYLTCIAFAIPFLWIIRYYDHYIPSFDTEQIFPAITVPDYIALLATALASVCLYTYNQRHTKAKAKYDSLRHDIMDDIGSMVCNCHEQCNCREVFIKDLDENGIDLFVR